MARFDRRLQAALSRRRFDDGLGGGGVAAFFKYTAGDSLAGWTTARASVAYYYDVNGVVTQAGSGVMRDGHYLGGVRHWLLEPACTNLCGQSDNFGTSWVNVCTATGSQVDIYGGTAGYNLNDTSGAVVQGSTLVPATFTGSTVKGFQIAVKKGASPAASGSTILVTDTVAVANRLLATLTWSGANPSLAMTTGTYLGNWPLTNGYFALMFQTTSVTAANAHTIVVNPAGTAAEQGDLYAGGIQLEDATRPSMIQPTSAGANRVADSAPTRPHGSTPQARTLYADLTDIGNKLGPNDGYFQIGTTVGTGNDTQQIVQAGSQFYGTITNSGTQSTGGPLVGGSVGDHMELRCASSVGLTATGGIAQRRCRIDGHGGSRGGVSSELYHSELLSPRGSSDGNS